MRKWIKAIVVLGVLAVSFVGGFTADTLREAPKNLKAARWKMATMPPVAFADLIAPRPAHADNNALPPGETYEAVLNIIRAQYYSENAADRARLNPTRLTYAAINGMLNCLNDRYTEFITPAEYKEMLEEQSGNFVGIGARLDVTRDDKIVIVEPIEGSPAVRAGILAGDVVTAVNGKPVAGIPVDDVIEKIRGSAGTDVRLTVERKGRFLTFQLKRTLVHSPLIESRMIDPQKKIGYIRLTAFYEQADLQFDAALVRLESQDMRGLIFDLRDNRGGLLNMAQSIASRFLMDGPVVWVQEKNGSMHSLNVNPQEHRGKLYKGAYPVVALVNGDSASASEIVAGALQDSRTATLVGTRTYGKGLVQTIIPLADDSAVKITTQHYFTRNKHDINMKRDEEGHPLAGTGGVLPDITVEFPEADANRQRDALRATPRNQTMIDRCDPQLQKAVQTLLSKFAR